MRVVAIEHAVVEHEVAAHLAYAGPADRLDHGVERRGRFPAAAPGEVRITGAVDDQVAGEHAVLDRAARRDPRAELVAGPQQVERRGGRQHLRDGRRDERSALVLPEHGPGLGAEPEHRDPQFALGDPRGLDPPLEPLRQRRGRGLGSRRPRTRAPQTDHHKGW
jgi:hypothetical protein